jgi:hypothetical protein
LTLPTNSRKTAWKQTEPKDWTKHSKEEKHSVSKTSQNTAASSLRITERRIQADRDSGRLLLYAPQSQPITRTSRIQNHSHKCTLLGLRAVYENSELPRQPQQAMDERINADYYIDPEKLP